MQVQGQTLNMIIKYMKKKPYSGCSKPKLKIDSKCSLRLYLGAIKKMYNDLRVDAIFAASRQAYLVYRK